MSEQERTQPWEAQETQVWEISVDDLNRKIVELWDLEKKLFWWDGKIWDWSIDSNIDFQFTQWIEKAKTIQEKVFLVENLISYFSDSKINWAKYSNNMSEFLNDDSKKHIQFMKNEYEKFIQKYPDFSKQIEKELFYYLELTERNFNFVIMSSDSLEQKKDTVSKFLEWSKNWFLSDRNSIEKLIIYINKLSPNLTDKPAFLNRIWQLDFEEKEKIILSKNKLNTLLSLDFVKEGFTDDEESPIYDKTFWYGTLIRLLNKTPQDLTRLNQLYISSDNIDEFWQMIDWLDISIKEWLLQSDKIKEKYLPYCEKKLGLSFEDTIQKKIDSDVLFKISNISDNMTRKYILQVCNHLLWTFFSRPQINILWNMNQSSYLPEQSQIISSTQEDIHSILSPWWSLDNILDQFNNDIKQQISIIGVFQTFLKKHINQSFIWQQWDYQVLLEKKVSEVNTRYEQFIQTKVSEIRSKLQLTPDKLRNFNLQYEAQFNDRDSTLQSRLDFVQNYNVLPNEYSQITPSNRGDSSEVIETPPESRINSAQQAMNKLWFNVKVWEDGSLVWVNGETNLKQTIWNRTFEIWNDGKIFIQWAFWYKFSYENNIDWIEKYLEIADEIEYVDHMWLGHFWDSFKEMISILNQYSQHTWLRQINIDDKSLNSTNFINQIELDNIVKVFYKIWFLDTDSYSFWFKNWIMEKVQFTHIMDEKFEGNNFFKWWVFSPNLFKEIVVKTDWNKK